MKKEEKKINISKKLLKSVGKTNAYYELIKENDRVLLGLSGGKDSLTLAHILKHMQRVAPFDFEFKAVAISYGMGEDFSKLKEHCKEFDIPFEVYKTNIFEIAEDKIRQNSSFCSFFSRMRRGALYSVALKYGFKKVALGHHLDDAVESFFMNMFYNGTLRSMPPIYKTQKGLYVIRPLIEVRERQLLACAIKNNFPVIGDEACPSMKFDVKMPYARAQMKEFLQDIEKRYKDIFKYIKTSFKHIHDDTFLDKSRFKL
ncbi:MAG TPA: tRNA 2-thiocytidine biosynthesis protein TtcA [Campylobacterales bacterium]|nr:tRNA 2-thiocytidine biosynthesis protein TtcA [Campylobacterales bacterium]